MDLDIEGNAAVVTASSSGLGKASATALAREGANVVINGRDEDRLAEAVEDVESVATGEVVAAQGDLTDRSDVEALVAATVEEFGGLDHLVTSAGGPPSGAFLDTTDEDWYEAYDLLVMSVVRAVREAAPHLRADGGGTVVNVTSRSVKEASAGNVLSSAVRMAVVGFEKTLSTELAPDVRANTVLPGSIATPRVEAACELMVERGEAGSYEEALAMREAAVPLDRLGDPMELGDTVAFLSSPRSGYINGQAIPVEGGSGSSTF
ncbi:MAG: SDR family oxidoreductase [Haloferacaceae archaeon]